MKFKSKILIIVECPMARKKHIEAIDVGLRDVCSEPNEPFRGKIILLMGNKYIHFCQTVTHL